MRGFMGQVRERERYKVLVENPEKKKPLRRPRRTRRWEDNIKMDFKET
jgi:hypothetical protein